MKSDENKTQLPARAVDRAYSVLPEGHRATSCYICEAWVSTKEAVPLCSTCDGHLRRAKQDEPRYWILGADGVWSRT